MNLSYCKIQILIFDVIKEFYKNPEGLINCIKSYKKKFSLSPGMNTRIYYDGAQALEK